jgi:branched-chain amino acid aminotransferase
MGKSYLLLIKQRLFRPDLNAARLQRSCKAVSMPAPTTEMFLTACIECATKNKDFVPPNTSIGSLYIRPIVFATSAHLGLSPSTEYKFVVLCSPVGSYYAGGIGTPVKALIKAGFDRAAPGGMVFCRFT